jgi:hypothetical protein
VAFIARRRGTVGSGDNPRRAALALLGMLAVAGVLLAAPFVYIGMRIEAAHRVPAARVAAIEHSSCAQLREQLASVQADGGSDSSFDLAGNRGATMSLIVRRAEQLHCRPSLRVPYD